jgi:prepilin-type N-terminal cleavage/methylation domain-containing protein
MRQPTDYSAGFTLIELLIVMAVLGLLVTVGLASTSKNREKTNQDNAKTLILSALEEARSRALSGYVETGTSGLYDHGVRLESNQITTFQTTTPTGSYPGSGDTALLPGSMTLSCSPACPLNIFFTRLTGKTRLTSPATLTLNPGNIIITINPDGTIVAP